jgi:hypothetical protein
MRKLAVLLPSLVACAAVVRPMMNEYPRPSAPPGLDGLKMRVQVVWSLPDPNASEASTIQRFGDDYRASIASRLNDAGVRVLGSGSTDPEAVLLAVDIREPRGESQEIPWRVELRHGDRLLESESFTTYKNWRCPEGTGNCLAFEEENRIRRVVSVVFRAGELHEIAAAQRGAPTTKPAAARAPARAAVPLVRNAKMVVIPLRPRGIAVDTAELTTGLLMSAFDKVKNLETVGSSDVEAMLGLERQKDMLGCSTSACAAEIGGALGAELVLYGELGKLGGNLALTLNAIHSPTSRVAARVSRVFANEGDEMVAGLPDLVAELVERLNKSLP